MSRLPNLDPNALSGYQKQLYDRIAAQRGAVRGPFNAWLYSPELCDRVEALGAFVRFTSDIPMQLKEIAVLQIARHFTCQYMWVAHVKFAQGNGVSRDVIDTIARRQRPEFGTQAERVVYDFTQQLLTAYGTTDETWTAFCTLFDKQRAVEFTAFIGNFSMVALALNNFRVELPKTEEALLG